MPMFRRQYLTVRRQRGQAMAEVLVSTLALVPIFVLTPYLGKYLDVKSKTAEAARYVTWERSVYSDPGATWGSGEHSKSDARLIREARQRVLGGHRAAITSDIGTPTDNPLWRDHVGSPLVDFTGYEGSATLAENDANVSRGFRVDLTSAGGSVIGLLDIGLGLNDESEVRSNQTLALAPLPDFSRRGASIDIQVASIASPQTPLTPLTQSGALFTDAWLPGSEDNFADRIDGLVADEVLALFVAPGTLTFGNTPLFREGASGQNPKLTSESGVVPIRDVDELGDSLREAVQIFIPPPFNLLF